MTTLTNYSPSISPKSFFPGPNRRHRTSPPASPFTRPQASPRSTPAQYRDVKHSGTESTVSINTTAIAVPSSSLVTDKVGRSRDFGTQYTPPDYPPTTGRIIMGELSSHKINVDGEKRDGEGKTAVTEDQTDPHDQPEENGPPPSQQPPQHAQAQPQPHVLAAVTKEAGRQGSNASSTSMSSSSLVNCVPSSPKRSRPSSQQVKTMPKDYKFCDVNDLGLLISDMLLELIRINDRIPLKDGILTRFHSRAPPAISVRDYLNRLIIHATLSPPLLLSTVYYIDRLCALYPAFTISSLTVHRFLITASTVAAKGLSDSFWTNHTYARVGGVSTKELGMLELDFLDRLEWRIVPPAEVLEDYYRSLVARMDGYELETEDKGSSQPA